MLVGSTEVSALRLPAPDGAQAEALREIAAAMEGELRCDDVHRVLYASDASIYELTPLAVALPRSADDLAVLVRIAGQAGIPLTPRAAGTSLAGQATGPGIVVDTGRWMNRLLEVDEEARTVRVEPGVVLDELNRRLRPRGLFFGPDTSTSNRCMIGGMIGNNSCGSHSILYGTTRDHLAGLELVMADGARVRSGAVDRQGWGALVARGGVLGAGLQALERVVRDNEALIRERWPDPRVRRRNTGYPLDELLGTFVTGGDAPVDLSRFFCGTEGTLALTAEATLRLVDAPRHNLVIAAHFGGLQEALEATVVAVGHAPAAVELMDRRILELSRLNPEQEKNRWFVEGDPDALLVIELYGESDEALEERADALVRALRGAELGYAWPVIRAPRIGSVWELRKAGLGVLMGAPGDVKPVTLVEDTAVAVEDLPRFVEAFSRIMASHSAECVYYAHASVGELHLRPELDLKLASDARRARAIAEEVADLVRDFRGALSGEHGDGRLRSPFLERVLGADGCALLAEVKDAFDPTGVLNPGTIVRPEPFEAHWRTPQGYRHPELGEQFEYAVAGDMQRMVERCNGAGVCRRKAEAGGTMCPSYMVTLEERESTRGRANLFRRLIQEGPDALYDSDALADALDLCISCKGCQRDCPASVDMAKLKADFLQGRMDRHGVPRRSRLFAEVTEVVRRVQRIPGAAWIGNRVQGSGLFRRLVAPRMGIHPARPLPQMASRSFHAWWRRRVSVRIPEAHGCVLLYVDEFTAHYEPELGIAAVELLEAGGWEVLAPKLGPSGRTWLSKGLVREAKAVIDRNLERMHPLLPEVEAIVGLEPSALLTFRDEAVDLQREDAARVRAQEVADRVLLCEDFIAQAARSGRWRAGFTDAPATILLHGHCHQKAQVGTAGMRAALSLPANWEVREVPSGCCGMTGSFGYEIEHYDTSMAIGELVLFPAVREADAAWRIAAPGTSCRHQIADGTGRVARHPVQLLREALADLPQRR